MAPGGVQEAPRWLPSGLLEASWGLLGSLGRFWAPRGGFGEVFGEDSGTLGPAKTWFIRVRGCKNLKIGGSGKRPKKSRSKTSLRGAFWPPWGSFGVSRGSLARLLGSLGVPRASLGVPLGSFASSRDVFFRLFGGSDFASVPLGVSGGSRLGFGRIWGTPPGRFWEDLGMELLKKSR